MAEKTAKKELINKSDVSEDDVSEDDLSEDLKHRKIQTDAIPEYFINYNAVPPLQYMSVVNIVTALCEQSDIKDAIIKHSPDFHGIHCLRCNTCRGILNEISQNLLSKLYFLPLPDILKSEVSDIIEFIVTEILDWSGRNRKNTENIGSIYWTIEGTIDRAKTLEKVIAKYPAHYEYIRKNYELACTYCLDNSIRKLWQIMPEELRKVYLRGRYLYNTDMHEPSDSVLITYWTDTSITNTNYANTHMLEDAVLTGNIYAVKYFWKTLTKKEISSKLPRWVNDLAYNLRSGHYENSHLFTIGKFEDVLFFLLSKLDDTEQQKKNVSETWCSDITIFIQV